MGPSVRRQGGFLIASLQPSSVDEDLLRLQRTLVESVGEHRAKGVVIDAGVVEVLDSFATRTVRDIALMVKLRGAETVVAGIQLEVALAMVRLGLSLGDVTTALDVEDGMAYLDRRCSQAPPSQASQGQE